MVQLHALGARLGRWAHVGGSLVGDLVRGVEA